MDQKRRYVLAVTGASGAPFAESLLKKLAQEPAVTQLFILSSPTGRRCFLDETGERLEDVARRLAKTVLLDEGDLGAEISSGSALHGGMVIVPCSAGTLGRIASGTSENLITRAADVCLKEGRPLVLCLRETPLNRVHMRNMLEAHDAGATIMPLTPALYTRPRSINDLCDDFAARIMDRLGLAREGARRWNG